MCYILLYIAILLYCYIAIYCYILLYIALYWRVLDPKWGVLGEKQLDGGAGTSVLRQQAAAAHTHGFIHDSCCTPANLSLFHVSAAHLHTSHCNPIFLKNMHLQNMRLCTVQCAASQTHGFIHDSRTAAPSYQDPLAPTDSSNLSTQILSLAFYLSLSFLMRF